MPLDIIATLGGLVIPPLFSFLKGIFGGKNDSPEAVASTLATTKPEALGPFMDALAKLRDATTKEFNKDVIGEVSRWVSNLRAVIRPLCTALSIVFLVADGTNWLTLSEGARLTMEAIASSWFGSKFSLK